MRFPLLVMAMIDPVRSNPMSNLAPLQRRYERAADRVRGQAESLAQDAATPNRSAESAGAAGIAGALTQMDTAKLAMVATLKMAMKSNEAVASLVSSYGREG